MRKAKFLMSAGLLGVTSLVSAPAMAELTGNAGVMSEYLFRGLPQAANGASAYGGLDYAHESGFYVGTWAATIGLGSGNTGPSAELDLYTGFAGEVDALSYDLGVIYYWYPEEDQSGNLAVTNNTIELYGSVGVGPVSLSAYYAPDTYFAATDPDTNDPNDEADGAYGAYVSFSQPLTDVLSFDAAVGYNGGEGNETFAMDDSGYIEYNLGVSAALDNGFAMSFGFVDTDIDTPGFEDDPKPVVNASYSFDL